MKSLNETFTDEEYEELKKAKGNMNWHDFILSYAYRIRRRSKEQ